MNTPLVEVVARAISRSYALTAQHMKNEVHIAAKVEEFWDEWTPEAEAALAAIEASGEWVVVPKALTDKLDAEGWEWVSPTAEARHFAMIAARPKVTP